MTWKFLSTGPMRHLVAMMISFLALGFLNPSFGQTETPQSSPSNPKKQPTSLADNKVGDDFRLLFGEAGETSVASISLGKSEVSKVVLECGDRVDVDAREFLVVWNAKEIPTDRKKPVRRSSKAVPLTSKSKDALAILVQSAATVQLVRIINSATQSEQVSVAQEFLAHPKFAQALALVIEPEAEDLAKILRVARLLIAERGQIVERFPQLAAAIAVVDDAPVVMQINENLAQGCGPLPTFDHFVANEKKMLFGLKNIAPELLIYMVDIAALQNEMDWALRTYAGNRAVGELYDKIEYDFDHLEKGRPKKVSVAGWNLQNILRYGGVCADQAHFATTVGKSIGVPCVFTTATDGVLSHAWIGFVGKSGNRPMWIEVGRYGGYQSVEGFIRDPQTGNLISNTQMPMLLTYGMEPVSDRLSSAGLRIAAGRLLRGSVDPKVDPKVATPPSAETITQVLALIHVAVEACVTDARSWEVVALAAKSGAMTTQQKQQWSADILTLCGDSYPEFAWRTISPMINSIADVEERQQALDGSLAIFNSRGDLAGQILLQQATLFKSQGDPLAAGRCYETILNRYANDGPFAIVALQEASKLLAEKNNAIANVTLHERAFGIMEVPIEISPRFARQSNWYRSGVMLAQALRIVGRSNDALLLEQRMSDVMK